MGMDATAVVIGRRASGPRWPGEATARVAKQRTDALPPLALASLVLGCGTLGSESLLLDLLRLARLRLTPQAVALSRNSRRELRDEMAGSGTLDEAAQIGDGAAHTLGLQPAGEFVEKGLGQGRHSAEQQPGSVALGWQQTLRKDQGITTTPRIAGQAVARWSRSRVLWL
jgi:hypothetical protein